MRIGPFSAVAFVDAKITPPIQRHINDGQNQRNECDKEKLGGNPSVAGKDIDEGPENIQSAP